MTVKNALALSLAATTFLTGAGFAFASGSHGDGHGSAPDIGKQGSVTEATRMIEIDLIDNEFTLPELKVRNGETVRFVIHNKGDFLHEFNIGTKDMHAEHQEEMMTMFEHGMISFTSAKMMGGEMNHGMGEGGDMMMHDDPNSVLVEPGKTKELVWTFSDAEGLQFACNIPGHYESGMVGDIKFVESLAKSDDNAASSTVE